VGGRDFGRAARRKTAAEAAASSVLFAMAAEAEIIAVCSLVREFEIPCNKIITSVAAPAAISSRTKF